jgi:signal recognition particle subunit SEC65/rRNA processing protein Gar1
LKDYDHVVLWLDYFNKNLKRRQGRKVKRDQAVFDPTVQELVEATRAAGFQLSDQEINSDARFPRRSFVKSGYVMVAKKEGIKKSQMINPPRNKQFGIAEGGRVCSLFLSVFFSSQLVSLQREFIAYKKITIIISSAEAYDKSNQPMPITQTNEVGEIIHLAKSGRLIVKLNAAGAERIKAGELLIDGSGRKVGRVAELLGPVKTPYASVITMTDRTSRLVGSKVFGGGFAKKPHDRSRGFRRSNSR